jgi:hypothetical protein
MARTCVVRRIQIHSPLYLGGRYERPLHPFCFLQVLCALSMIQPLFDRNPHPTFTIFITVFLFSVLMTVPFGTRDKEEPFFPLEIGKPASLVLRSNGVYFGIVMHATNRSIVLEPHLIQHPTQGHYSRFDGPQHFHTQDVMAASPYPDEMYHALQQPHPWVGHIGEKVYIVSKSGRDTIGVLEDVLQNTVTLSAQIAYDRPGSPREIIDSIGIDRSDVLAIRRMDTAEYDRILRREGHQPPLFD